ncbi:hypothetical protein FPZ12_000800 [Amycolatopsis acidicola]|uniref:Flagellar basal body-associated protein FliL n=1 Tax=Amycolatopsis acidicola TaxID=2596893 RepID=A0A5N0VQ88_9PSEU|nr:hypothetical protein [Amycolatopsis acidicola]KAA9166781.1 hypothetical protein FPZ12_000800 [Amycolatopsis acidicola]
MSWQDELRRLDAELASGKISLHQHRKQRDELLAAASGGMSPSPVPAPVNQPRQWQVTVPAPQPQQWQATVPAPESQQWQATAPVPHPEPEPEPEPAMTASEALLHTDRPTSAPSPADYRATESIPYPMIHEAPTVITPVVRTPSLPGLTPPPAQPPSVPSLPTIPKRTGRGRPTWLFVTLGVLVVLAMILCATYFLGARDDTTTAAQPTSSPTLAPQDAAGAAEARLPTLPGEANPNNSTMSIDKAVQLKLVSEGDAALMKASGAQEIVYRASSDPANSPNGNMVLAVPATSAAEAAKLVATLRKNLTANGFVAEPHGPAESDIAYTGSDATGRVSALWYTSGSLAVGIGVSQPSTSDPAQLRSRLEQIRTQVTGALPAG